MTREQQQRTKIKICGLKRPEDITYVNEAKKIDIKTITPDTTSSLTGLSLYFGTNTPWVSRKNNYAKPLLLLYAKSTSTPMAVWQ